MPHGDGKRVSQAVSQDAALSTRHAYVVLSARMRLSLPVWELANTLSIPVVRKPFELEVSAFDRGPSAQQFSGRVTSLHRAFFCHRSYEARLHLGCAAEGSGLPQLGTILRHGASRHPQAARTGGRFELVPPNRAHPEAGGRRWHGACMFQARALQKGGA